MRKISVLLVLLAALAMFATPAQAAVQFAIYLSTNGTTWTNANSIGSLTQTTNTAAKIAYDGTYNGLTITNLEADTNSPGTPSLAQLLGVNSQITNPDTGTAHTIHVLAISQGYMQPSAAPLTLTSHIGGTSVGNGNVLTFQSWLDQTNNPLTSLGYTPSLNSQTTGLQLGSTLLPGSFSSDGIPVSYLTNVGTPYEFVQEYTLRVAGNNALFPNHNIGWQSNTNLAPPSPATPEPATMTLWGIGLAACGFAARRRRNAKVA